MNTDDSTRRDFVKGAGAAAGIAAITALGSGAVVNAEEVGLNAMQPTPEQLQAFMKLPSGPVVMVNLLMFKANGGREAYAKYGEGVSKILKSLGAELFFSSQCHMALIGGATWDSVAMVRYPDKLTLLKMAQMPEYLEVHKFRDEGLEGQINLACFEMTPPGADA